MHNNIKETLNNGKSEFASETEQKEMFALFHQSESEYELKGLLLEELEKTEVKETSSPFFKELFTKLWAKIEKRNTPSKSNVKFFKTFSRIAAAVIFGLLAGIYVPLKNNNNNPVYYGAHAPKGSISEMMLPDSSIIFLNAGSSIKYSVDGEKGVREVFLDGEAWFDVHNNKRKPFIVHTSLYNVNVTGTRFNIKAYESDNKITTTLEEGTIIIEATENCKLAEDITLIPGEQMVLYKETKQVAIKTVNAEWYTSWKDNKLIFVNMGMKDLIVLLERRYGVDIEVKNETLLDLHFDGTIKNETIIEILEIIKKTLPVNYTIEDQKIKITSN